MVLIPALFHYTPLPPAIVSPILAYMPKLACGYYSHHFFLRCELSFHRCQVASVILAPNGISNVLFPDIRSYSATLQWRKGFGYLRLFLRSSNGHGFDTDIVSLRTWLGEDVWNAQVAAGWPVIICRYFVHCTPVYLLEAKKKPKICV